MSIVHIRINGREYDVACDDGQEEHLRLLADEVDERVRALARALGSGAQEAQCLLLSALMMADEIFENKKEINNVAAEVERMAGMLEENKRDVQEGRMVEVENAMAVTLEEIAVRIEKIARQIEVS